MPFSRKMKILCRDSRLSVTFLLNTVPLVSLKRPASKRFSGISIFLKHSWKFLAVLTVFQRIGTGRQWSRYKIVIFINRISLQWFFTFWKVNVIVRWKFSTIRSKVLLRFSSNVPRFATFLTVLRQSSNKDDLKTLRNVKKQTVMNDER